jgi:NADPH-dependent ferric siderophore reductase
VRREPPRFRDVAVREVERLGPHMARVTLTGDELTSMAVPGPAASVRLLLPSPGSSGLVRPTWNGNEFLLPDGSRPTIRTFTPRRFDPHIKELDLDIVLHDGGAASAWVAGTRPREHAAISGPGRGYTVERDAPSFLLAGDESAIPAIGQLLETLPTNVPVQVHVEVARPDARLPVPRHPRAKVEWYDLPSGAPPGDALLEAMRSVDLAPDERVWVAGEAAAVQRIRRHFFDERGVPRARTAIRGYWKFGRAGDGDDD